MRALQALRESITVMQQSSSVQEVTFAHRINLLFTVEDQIINDNEVPGSWSFVEVESVVTNGIPMQLGIIELIGVRLNFKVVDAKTKFITTVSHPKHQVPLLEKASASKNKSCRSSYGLNVILILCCVYTKPYIYPKVSSIYGNLLANKSISFRERFSHTIFVKQGTVTAD